MAVTAKVFHTYVDAEIHPNYRRWFNGTGTTTETVDKHFIIQERSVGYHFYSHFHPYIAELVDRLIRGGVRGLQAADTDYRTNPDGTWEALPSTTLAALSASTQITRADGSQATLPAGVQVILPDATQVALDGGGQGALPGSLLVTDAGGVKLTLADASTAEVPNGTGVTLTGSTQGALPTGEAVTLPEGTRVALFGGRPRPVLHETLFSTAAYMPSELVQQPHPVRDLASLFRVGVERAGAG